MRTQAPQRHTGRSAAWWLRLCLALVLALDLVAAPLHPHHHGMGLDGTALLAAADHPEEAASHHIEDDGQPSLYHATATIRAGASAASADTPDTGSPEPLAGWLPAWLGALLSIPEAAPLRLTTSSHQAPPRPTPLSRPPEGRAPPQRA